MIELAGSLATWGSAAAILMGSWWSRPTEEEIAGRADLDRLAGQVAHHLGLGSHTVDPALVTAQGNAVALAGEYERLFVGPGSVPCAPYESVWRQDVPGFDRGMLLGPAALAVEDLYRRMGLRIRSAAHEMPDHVAVEWEAVAYAIGEAKSAAVASGLLSHHLRVWVPPFCRAVANETEVAFYRALALLTPQWIEALSAALETLTTADGEPGGIPTTG